MRPPSKLGGKLGFGGKKEKEEEEAAEAEGGGGGEKERVDESLTGNRRATRSKSVIQLTSNLISKIY